MRIASQYTLQLNKSIVKDMISVERAFLTFIEGCAPEGGRGGGGWPQCYHVLGGSAIKLIQLYIVESKELYLHYIVVSKECL